MVNLTLSAVAEGWQLAAGFIKPNMGLALT
jgi:hypothetical protein